MSFFWIVGIFNASYKEQYTVLRYERKDRHDFFYKCARFLDFNRIDGDYLEFGCYGANTFEFAHKFLKGRHLYGFDSFQGLPTPKGIDIHQQWKQGDWAIKLDEFKNDLKSLGFRKEEYTLIPGFYSESLTDETRNKLMIDRVAFIYIDCDLYESTVPVLNFVIPFLQTGTIVAFDDFYCFNGDPDRGEQMAMTEFLSNHPEIELIPYLNFGWHGKSYIVKKSGDENGLRENTR